MTLSHLSTGSAREDWERAVVRVLQGHAAADPVILQVIHHCHPRFLDEVVKWLPRPLTPQDIARAPFTEVDARLVVARAHAFADWEAVVEQVDAEADPESPVGSFERAVDATIDGQLDVLRSALERHPGLVHARSRRRTCFDPSVHGATLLHYLVANGVENYRQRTPANAVAVASTILDAGADPGALAWLYGGECSVMSMLVSSSHPAEAGVQSALVELLVARGAPVEQTGRGQWTSPLRTALVFGFREVAETLVRCGARVDTLAAAAGLGQVADVQRLLPAASGQERRAALALGVQNGETGAVAALLEGGVDPNGFNPEGYHAHGTPLHHAAWRGDADMVRLLLRFGAQRSVADRTHHSTPEGWARYAGRTAVADLLAGDGA